MPVTGDQQNIGRMELLKAFAHIARFGQRGILFESTNAYLRGHLFGVLAEKRFRIFGGGVAEISGIRGSVEQQVPGVTGAQQLHATTVTLILAVTGEDHDHIRFFRMITHQHAAGEPGKR